MTALITAAESVTDDKWSRDRVGNSANIHHNITKDKQLTHELKHPLLDRNRQQAE